MSKSSLEWYHKNKESINDKRRGTRKEEHKASYKKRLNRYGAEALNEMMKANRIARPEVYQGISERSKKNNPERNMFNNAKSRAEKKGTEFTICKEDIVIPKLCPYLKQPLDAWSTNKEFVPSLDRIDNTKGYIPGNIEVISFLANRMKNAATKEQLVEFAKNILERYVKYE